MLQRLIKKILILLIIYTPVKEILLKIIIKRGYHWEKTNYFFKVLENIFWEQYFCKIKNPYFQRELTSKSLLNGNGENGQKNTLKISEKFKRIKKKRVGNLSALKAIPIHQEIYNFIKKENLNNSKTSIIQIGSSSGSDLIFLNNYFKKQDIYQLI